MNQPVDCATLDVREYGTIGPQVIVLHGGPGVERLIPAPRGKGGTTSGSRCGNRRKQHCLEPVSHDPCRV